MTSKDTVKEYCDKYLKKYVIIEDLYETRCLFVKHIFLNAMERIMVLCNSVEIEYHKDLYTEENIFHLNYFETLVDEGRMMDEDEFTNVFKKRMFEMTDYLLKYIRRV